MVLLLDLLQKQIICGSDFPPCKLLSIPISLYKTLYYCHSNDVFLFYFTYNSASIFLLFSVIVLFCILFFTYSTLSLWCYACQLYVFIFNATLVQLRIFIFNAILLRLFVFISNAILLRPNVVLLTLSFYSSMFSPLTPRFYDSTFSLLTLRFYDSTFHF